MLFLTVLWSLVIAIWIAIAVRHWKFGTIPVSYSIAGVVAVICGSVFGYDFFHIPAPIPITSDRLLIGILVFVFGCMVVRKRQRIQSLSATDYSIYGLLAVLIGSALFTEYGYKNNLPISRFIFFYFLPAALYFVVRNSDIKSFDLKVVSGLFVFFCVYLALTGIAESRGWYGLVFPSYISDPSVVEFLGRGRGPFLNPISNGIFLTAGLALALMMFFYCEGKLKWVFAATVPILFLGNITTLTRSVWLAALVIVGAILWIKTTQKQKGALLIAGTVAGIVLMAVLGGNLINFKRDKHVSENEMSQSAQLRPIFAVIAWDMFKDRPLLGCGFGQYNKYKPQYLQSPYTELPLAKAKPYLQHNVFLSVLTETGIAGTAFLVWLIINGSLVGLRIYRHSNSSNWERAFAVTLIAIISSYCINGMFHDVSIIPMANLLMFYLLAINVSIDRHLQDAYNRLLAFKVEHDRNLASAA